MIIHLESDLAEKEELAVCFLKVASKILPGISRLKEILNMSFILLFSKIEINRKKLSFF